MKILAIDPGPIESAYVVWDGENIQDKDKIENKKMLKRIAHFSSIRGVGNIVIEMVASYGMPVGEDVFETCVWIGKFLRESEKYYYANEMTRIKRHEVKMHLCKKANAKDSNIIAAIVDRFDPNRKYGKHGKGTKKNPGPLYGFVADEWQAFALALTYYDKNKIQI